MNGETPEVLEAEVVPPRTTRAVLLKVDLIEEVSRAVKVPQKEAALIVELILNTMVRALYRSDRIEIRGFGSFGTRQRGPRLVRNPKTGTQVEVPAKRIPYFKPRGNSRNTSRPSNKT